MYSTTLIVEVPHLNKTTDELMRDIFEPYYEQLDNDLYEENLIREYEQPMKNNPIFSRWYSRTDKKLARSIDNKRHKKSRYSYHKARV